MHRWPTPCVPSCMRTGRRGLGCTFLLTILIGCSPSERGPADESAATPSATPSGGAPSASASGRGTEPERDGGPLVVGPGAFDAGTLAEDGAVADADADASTEDSGPSVGADAGPSDSSATNDAAIDDAAPGTGPADAADAGVDASLAAPFCAGVAGFEVEPNDDAAQATAFTQSICGELGPGANEVDFVTFTPPNMNFHVTLYGEVTWGFAIDGASATVPPAISIPYTPGKPYVVEVRAKNPTVGAAYRIDLNLL